MKAVLLPTLPEYPLRTKLELVILQTACLVLLFSALDEEMDLKVSRALFKVSWLLRGGEESECGSVSFWGTAGTA